VFGEAVIATATKECTAIIWVECKYFEHYAGVVIESAGKVWIESNIVDTKCFKAFTYFANISRLGCIELKPRSNRGMLCFEIVNLIFTIDKTNYFAADFFTVTSFGECCAN
jgi:hypothetical protein